ncbi:hypothetical protein AAG570_004916 [Ranatra chinensis]|uniref:Spermatogenesis-associated protein 6 N-terminal domain-containing protein n=1 Tax=Ranatra chinensis TaxID=642074 RepID=A0ABD0XZU3_9HEMI
MLDFVVAIIDTDPSSSAAVKRAGARSGFESRRRLLQRVFQKHAEVSPARLDKTTNAEDGVRGTLTQTGLPLSVDGEEIILRQHLSGRIQLALALPCEIVTGPTSIQSGRIQNDMAKCDNFQVSCPGVWLCPKGKVYLKVSLFGVSDTTKKVEPTYPLVFNERFVFQKAFTGVASFEQLGGVLEKKELLLDLVQVANGPKRVVRLSRQQEKVTLSSFRSPICQLVYPTLFDPPGGPVRQRVTSTASEIDLLLSPSSKYPSRIYFDCYEPPYTQVCQPVSANIMSTYSSEMNCDPNSTAEDGD